MKAFVLVALPLSIVLSGCIEGDAGPTATPTTLSSGMSGNNMDGMEGHNMSGAKSIYTVATDVSSQPETLYKFRPASFTAKVGETLNVTIKGAVGNQYSHTFVIDALSLKIGPAASGQAMSKMIVAEKSGTYQFYCDVGNHRQLGMTGTLTIS